MRPALACIMPLLLAQACAERPTSVAGGTSTTVSEAVAAPQGDWVPTPAG